MNRGKRYSDEPKLNVKKVLAVVILIAVIIMFTFAIKKILKDDSKEKIASVSYFTVYTNEKYGVIDSKGKIIIQPNYDEMIIIPNKTEPVFICTYNVNYNNNTFKTKVLNDKNKEIFKEYQTVEPIYNYDLNNNLWFEKNALIVKKNGKYGLINYSGKLILDCKYDKIESLKGVENSLIITSGDKIGLVDNLGNIIIPTEYDSIIAIENNYKYGYIVEKDNKFGIIDNNKKVILEVNYEEIKPIYNTNRYVVKEDGKLKLIDKDANVLLDTGYDDIAGINGDNVIIIKNNKYGVITLDGDTKIESKYDSLKYAFAEYYIAKNKDKYGIVNLAGDEVLYFDYVNITFRKDLEIIEAEKEFEFETQIYDSELNLKITGIISEVNSTKGYLKIRENGEYKYYNLKFEEKTNKDLLTNNNIFLSKKEGKYGYVDKSGNVVVDYIYDDATELNSYGYAAVKKDGVWGSIDQNGKVIAEPKYELKNNLNIDFIDKYHISEDLNAFYYTDN